MVVVWTATSVMHANEGLDSNSDTLQCIPFSGVILGPIHPVCDCHVPLSFEMAGLTVCSTYRDQFEIECCIVVQLRSRL